MSSVSITVGQRSFVPSMNDFGVISRPSFLGLVNAPVVVLDDGTEMGIAGENLMTDLVSCSSCKNFNDETVTVPLDVKIVGIDTLTAMGVAPDVQTTMFAHWRSQLTDAQRADYSQQWIAASTASPADQKTFVDSMIAALS